MIEGPLGVSALMRTESFRHSAKVGHGQATDWPSLRQDMWCEGPAQVLELAGEAPHMKLEKITILKMRVEFLDKVRLQGSIHSGRTSSSKDLS